MIESGFIYIYSYTGCVVKPGRKACTSHHNLLTIDRTQLSNKHRYIVRIHLFTGLSGYSNAAKAKGTKSLIILVCWTIWRERNSRIFEGKEKNAARASLRDS
jgi:hypothetical protein